MNHPTTMQETPKLTIGPILFHWTEMEKMDFYKRIADEAPVDTVYLGEVICSKRTPFFEHHYDEVAERLKKAGKRVVFSTLSEVMIKRDRKIIRDFCDRGVDKDEEIEVNDSSALFHISGKPHRLGTLMNVYNEETLKYLASKGAYHVGLLPEMPRDAIENITKAANDLEVSTEVQIFGRASLALSARCYHARAHDRRKDNCQFICGQDPDGMDLNTLNGNPFLSINGMQTLSNAYLNLAYELDDLAEMGVSYFRLSPHTNNMVDTAKAFDSLMKKEINADEAVAKIRETGIAKPFANGFYHKKPGYTWVVSPH